MKVKQGVALTEEKSNDYHQVLA